MKEKLGIQAVYTGDEFKNFTLDLNNFSKILMDRLADDVSKGRNGGDLYNLIQQFKTKASISDEKNAKIDVATFNKITSQLREVKTPEELYLLRKAVEISCMGQNEVMKTLRPDMSELEVQGLHEFVHKKYGSEEVGYGSIVGAGENGCILHYMENSNHGYTSDVTRTIPAKGKFSAEEKIIYQLVYDAQEAAFKTLKNGANWADASTAAREVIANGLVSLGIIKDKKEVGKYYPHGLGHHVGLDVHDKSEYGPLKKDMVITIEPGIYIPPNSNCDKKWWSIAVRIEDDALITADGYELL